MEHAWRDRYGRYELWTCGRCIAVVQQVRGKWTVTIDAREPWQVIKGPAASKNQGRRFIERWLRARRLLTISDEPSKRLKYVPNLGHLLLGDSRTPEEREQASMRESKRRKGGNPNWWKNEQNNRPGG